MKKLALLDKQLSLNEIWSWYEDQKEALRDYKNVILDSFQSPDQRLKDKFFEFSRRELNNYFDKSFEELDHLVCFNIIAATESILMVDYYNKVYSKNKSELGKIFRDLYKTNLEKERRTSLENDILEVWKEYLKKGAIQSPFNEFKGILNYRHWLAHGRYWRTQFGEKYFPEKTMEFAGKIEQLILHS